MGQVQNKYHIADDGSVYKINEDGSFTECEVIERTVRQDHQRKIISIKFLAYFLMLFGGVLLFASVYGIGYAQGFNCAAQAFDDPRRSGGNAVLIFLGLIMIAVGTFFIQKTSKENGTGAK